MDDFANDTIEHSEVVLVVSSDDEDSRRLTSLLERRRYRWEHVLDLGTAIERASTSLYDLVVVDLPELSMQPDQLAQRIGADPYLGRFPLIVVHRDADQIPAAAIESLGLPVQFVTRPIEPTSVLVKVAHQLRLRKLQADEGRFLSKIASQNVELRELTNRFRRELREAQDIQRSILPTALPQAPNSSFAAAYVPLEAVGGDLYDIWPIGDDHLGIFIGDVTGHGLSAAFIGAMSKMSLAYASTVQPDEILAGMNQALCPVMPEGRFVTAAVAVYNPKTGEIAVARGGHPPPFVFRAATQSIESVTARGFPLGVMGEARYERYSSQLHPGDKFLLVTDGITETLDLGGKLLGNDGVAQLFCEAAAQFPIDRCLSFLLERQELFSEGRLIKDDITLVGLERLS